LAARWPGLEQRLDWVSLGDFPTPVERMAALERRLGAGPLYVKRDDLSSRLYGGNKVRTLEALFACARAAGARQILSTGAYGSNHAVATVLHAPRAGLEAGAVLFAQPRSGAALENLRVTIARSGPLFAVPHWSLFPLALFRARGPSRVIMAPGGATPAGALGYVAAGLELAEQVQSGLVPTPSAIVVGVGSTCTSAGLLVGLHLAARFGIGFREAPELIAVRVTPWPVTSRWRVLSLAERTAHHLADLVEDPSLRLERAELAPRLLIDGRELGSGYGIPSASGERALSLFHESGLFALDTTYSAKAAAGLIRLARERPGGPLLFWSTKSTAPLPHPAPDELRRAPAFVRRWMERARLEQRTGEALAVSALERDP
ncbi:MAG TPA: pyridoxal-phosphate dependent enzyme, partial [Polyangiaceae bacterium]